MTITHTGACTIARIDMAGQMNRDAREGSTGERFSADDVACICAAYAARAAALDAARNAYEAARDAADTAVAAYDAARSALDAARNAAAYDAADDAADADARTHERM